MVNCDFDYMKQVERYPKSPQEGRDLRTRGRKQSLTDEIVEPEIVSIENDATDFLWLIILIIWHLFDGDFERQLDARPIVIVSVIPTPSDLADAIDDLLRDLLWDYLRLLARYNDIRRGRPRMAVAPSDRRGTPLQSPSKPFGEGVCGSCWNDFSYGFNALHILF